jgi:methylated-DNA-[protein]-cysteine S-methyltransferase
MPALLHTATLSTPMGELTLAVDPDGALAFVAFADEQNLSALAGPDAVLSPDTAAHHTAAAVAELAEYFTGARRSFSIPVAPRVGTPFQRRVWAALPRIQPGTTWSYARLAAETAGVARAVGSANAANPLSIVVPCHRVIGADGTLTGYAGGLARKRWLLVHEGALLA